MPALLRGIGAVLLLSTLLYGCMSSTSPNEEGEWTPLFNGTDLTGWDTYIGPAVDSAGEKIQGTTLGLNNDPIGLFSVVEEDGEPAIRISGERGAGISTVDEFGDYHLRLRYKWGDERPWSWMRRMDSGLLYHAWGEHGTDNDYWLRSHEMQIMQETTGDYIAIEGATSDVRGRMVEGRYTYDPNAELHTISRQGFDPSGVSGAARITQSADFPEPGRWNTIELYALGRTSIHVVNGTVNMALFNSRKYVDGQESPLDRGKIQFQSEGAEIFLRNLELRRIDEIPAHLLEAVQPTR